LFRKYLFWYCKETGVPYPQKPQQSWRKNQQKTKNNKTKQEHPESRNRTSGA
jgi:hypothetical protein